MIMTRIQGEVEINYDISRIICIFTPNLTSMNKIITNFDIVKLRGVAYCKLYTICREPMSDVYLWVSSDPQSVLIKTCTSRDILDEYRSITNTINNPL